MAGVLLARHAAIVRARRTEGLARRGDDRCTHHHERHRERNQPGHLAASIREIFDMGNAYNARNSLIRVAVAGRPLACASVTSLCEKQRLCEHLMKR